MSIVDTIFRGRKSRVVAGEQKPTSIPRLLRGLDSDNATREEFDSEIRARVEDENSRPRPAFQDEYRSMVGLDYEDAVAGYLEQRDTKPSVEAEPGDAGARKGRQTGADSEGLDEVSDDLDRFFLDREKRSSSDRSLLDVARPVDKPVAASEKIEDADDRADGYGDSDYFGPEEDDELTQPAVGTVDEAERAADERYLAISEDVDDVLEPDVATGAELTAKAEIGVGEGHVRSTYSSDEAETMSDEPMNDDLVVAADDRRTPAADDFDNSYRESSSYEDGSPMARRSSPRLAEFAAFRAITGDMEDKLQSFAESVALSRLTFSSMQPFLTQFEADIQMSDEVERERNALAGEISDLRRNLEVTQRELTVKIAALTAANDRNSELRIELEQRRQTILEMTSKYDRLRRDSERANTDISVARAEIVRLVAALEREGAEKESYYQSRIDLTTKYAKLQQTEAQSRNKLLELTVQHDKLAKTHPALIAEQEKLRNEIRLVQRDKAEIQNRLLSSQDQVAQLESEIQALQGHAASESYAARTELEMHKSSLRTAEKAIAESDTRYKELQRQLRDAEVAKNTAESQVSILQGELDDVRKERADAAFKLSDVNLKYMTDLLSLDQQREQNKEFQYDIDTLLAEKRRMAKFESLYKVAEGQISSLKEKLGQLAENLKDISDPDKLRESIEIIGEMTAPHAPANEDRPPREGGKRVAGSH